LCEAIKNYFSVSDESAQATINCGKFLHPYGVIGALPWQESELPKRNFGEESKRNLYEISQSLLTFSEQIENEDELREIRSTIQNADQIVFLGNAFHPINLELLTPNRDRDTSRVIGTAYGISEPDCNIINEQIKDICMVNNETKTLKSGAYIIDNQITASNVFEKYRRTITS